MQLCRQTDQVPERVIKQAFIERTYGHQSSTVPLAFARQSHTAAFGFRLDVEGTQKTTQGGAEKPPVPASKESRRLVLYKPAHGHFGNAE